MFDANVLQSYSQIYSGMPRYPYWRYFDVLEDAHKGKLEILQNEFMVLFEVTINVKATARYQEFEISQLIRTLKDREVTPFLGFLKTSPPLPPFERLYQDAFNQDIQTLTSWFILLFSSMIKINTKALNRSLIMERLIEELKKRNDADEILSQIIKDFNTVRS